MTKPSGRYWDTKTLEEMTQEEWESLCDGCGLCCLTKLQDEDTDEIVYTSVVCRFSDTQTGQCSDYANRSTNVPTCVPLTLEGIAEFDWLPDSCAYRVIYRGDKLADWHPLNSGKKESVKLAGVGLLAIPLLVVDSDEIEDYEDFVMDKP
ncbi:YcgN family cysteine cluster protein [Hydrogenovibrio sp. JE_KL2]|uniref:YcgN family cysteine cluster protein n=1 Tax=Hydrogenovibrio sp. JE_KL2 TaxID=2651188 RepID=UPI00128C901D|nr:YcgN family cysteine cluster protein [Hydrogenovibrio sp. JE_KL2]MPQ76120.1 YcgN family cysteine cluster protein [Hydrogenovibrio sp. JE_KL2]